MLDIRETDAGVTLRVRVQPRAARDGVVGERAGALLVRLTAPPVEGAANAALVRLLAREIGRPPSAFSLIRGAGSRDKVLLVDGITSSSLRSKLQAHAEGRG